MVPFLKSRRCYANWFLSEFCNYRCFYCTNHHVVRPTEKWDTDKVLQTLAATGQKWCLGFTGGEPFAYPEFLSICKRAVQEDFLLYIATNLSPERPVNEFIDDIDPGMIENLAIALHIVEREKHLGVHSFLRLVDKLRKRNFPFEVQYVMHPILFSRFETDLSFFAREGISLIPKPFQGEYAGKLYPDSYRMAEQEIILKADPDAFRRGFYYARGIPCNAGRYLVHIEKDGTIYRCVSEKTVLGSCTTSLELFTEARPCKAPFCPCFGWDLIADESVKAALRKRLSNKAPLWIQARRYLGAWKRRIRS
ncbi:MAG: radical SAM protein [Chitinispirillaceae bacterium]|nr:radical SAM protein [Chitinispirillaceae bacterium]